LLCKGESESNFHTPNTIHFSSAYKPIFDFEKIFGLECGVPFLSELYKFEDAPELIQFFEHLGVTQTITTKTGTIQFAKIFQLRMAKRNLLPNFLSMSLKNMSVNQM
jgi:hypothetical protein